MKSTQHLCIPLDFKEKLSKMKADTLKWEKQIHSHTTINSKSTISFHSAISEQTFGNIILVPALATNSKIDPLMQSITYWALTHSYNIINIDTFLGDFESNLSTEQIIANNTYPEFKTILSASMNFIQDYKPTYYSIIVGHCTTADTLIDIFNDNIQHNEKIPVDAALFFAPWTTISDTHYGVLQGLINKLSKKVSINDNTTTLKLAHLKFVYAMRKFSQDIATLDLMPNLIAQWPIPATFITAGKDHISTHENGMKIFSQIKQESNNKSQFKYIHIPQAKHPFNNLYTDPLHIIEIIKSLHIKKR